MFDSGLFLGPRLIACPHMVDRVMHRKPSFRRYSLLRWLPPYRLLRAAYIRWTRRRWQRDATNWHEVPQRIMIRLPSGDFMMHPALKREIEAQCQQSKARSGFFDGHRDVGPSPR